MSEEVVDNWFDALGKPVIYEGRMRALRLLETHGYDRAEAAMVIDVVAREVHHDQPERAQRYLRTFLDDNLTMVYQVFAVMLARGPNPPPLPGVSTVPELLAVMLGRGSEQRR